MSKESWQKLIPQINNKTLITLQFFASFICSINKLLYFSFLMNEQGAWELSPAYDMTYIFNTGGFLPETYHCMMIHGKLTDISLADVMALAKENGIRPAEKIVHEVASAIMDFRKIATQCGVSDNWIAAVENTLNNYLEDWGLKEGDHPKSALTINGHSVANFHIEQQFKGNYLLTATIDGKVRL